MKAITIVTLVVTALLGNLVDRRPAPEPAPARRIEPTLATGDPIAKLIELHGLPDEIDYGLDLMVWRYGRVRGLEATIHDEVLVGLAGSMPEGRPLRRPGTDAPYLGQPAAEAARILGSPRTVYEGQSGSQFVYVTGWKVVYRFGRVVSCQRD
ncbi:MAG: hypothetical protein H6807_15780 [Planctomycetes bacterium]|nr:hypothetical protein [Planctomycetota bacterium]